MPSPVSLQSQDFIIRCNCLKNGFAAEAIRQRTAAERTEGLRIKRMYQAAGRFCIRACHNV